MSENGHLCSVLRTLLCVRLLILLVERPKYYVVSGQRFFNLQCCFVNVAVSVVEQHFAHYAGVAVIGNDVDDHAMVVLSKNFLPLLQEIFYELLLVVVSVDAVVLYKMAAPCVVSPENAVTQILYPLKDFLYDTFT